jgi:2-oxoglutarate ferredoxin oxidoreductase subunit gamma
MNKLRTKILFAGEGGQGVQVIAEILSLAAISEGENAAYIPNFGVEQRGGISLAFVIIDQKEIVYPKFEKADILAVLSDRAVKRVKRYIEKQTKVIKGPAMTRGLKTDLPPRVWNIVVLKAVNEAANIVRKNSIIKAMNQRFSKQFKKNPELKKLDLKAIS